MYQKIYINDDDADDDDERTVVVYKITHNLIKIENGTNDVKLGRSYE